MRQPPSGAAAEGEIHRAVALLKSGKERECLASLRRLNIRAENSPIICNLAALVCLSLGQYQLALKWFAPALALFPACGDAMAYRGRRSISLAAVPRRFKPTTPPAARAAR